MLIVQWSVIAVVVAFSTVYSLWRLLGTRQRLWLLDQLLPFAELTHWQRPGKLKASLQLQAMKSCGSCGSNAAAAPIRRSGAPRH